MDLKSESVPGLSKKYVIVVGAGLAGAEAAWQAANNGAWVKLYEMRPKKKTPAHHTGNFAELVCSNSFRAAALDNAVGLLKEEMRLLGSLIMTCADQTRVPAGGALAVDRELFSACVTEKLSRHSRIEIYREEVTAIPEGEAVIIATGPLTSAELADNIRSFTGENYLYFYDAVAPVVTAESINMDKVFRSSRYGKGEAAYLNCPMDKSQYETFWEALCKAEQAPRKEFDKVRHFEGCMPIEVLARRGKKTLLFGPLKPVGLTDPRTGRRPYAVVQLRQENNAATMYNLVGFQTSLKWSEQTRVFRLIPGLEKAEFVRLGVMHRNTYINSPVLLNPTFETKKKQGLFFAGQITGVEGYVESAASGLMAGINAARLLAGKELLVFPENTAHGSLAHYITTANPAHFQPMNVNYGLFPPREGKVKDKKEEHMRIARNALEAIESLKLRAGLNLS
ncbi:MAG TPA: methylenetetrahydrofolate--tRNA-(uracil(54)-C(5))-methyltransferase (FADH(2)-oxidizing) TrmFO [Bacillota bacterium]|jgi:methylenetetrahydrofolate--tRNA-(uracil-5-)-methyltransferase|nr:methylenetetrahydrofolate--tRNA-(uracil(54)-C(5))-methyltransferase (FADH(2)-oxidizing) TrmFO [Peptococcaceae bacterium MAG4]NLW38482.1 methylenetetrahydrofolate--tRNA-(uracil(54)-C(5))-methyltransferase (FADH(2)-oxidizing) TrmFO [Peptococcaceae bacterium]HPZ42467.1 methylenetetrahydrofolate--tRNA-(uracil(54)-C(5))-methyltransferase (FADH(2)-oxidizing) TrmFO [Bacillota bacterium]HQD75259.1 methylenetetrahydrofolate--tRNA-(uracil(54)-C(5))-methyltransferase (FADH(2)-oxidizing) TrmFO [Bacillota